MTQNRRTMLAKHPAFRSYRTVKALRPASAHPRPANSRIPLSAWPGALLAALSLVTPLALVATPTGATIADQLTSAAGTHSTHSASPANGAAPTEMDSGLFLFLAPLAAEPGPLTIQHTDGVLTFTRGRRSVSQVPRSSARADGLQLPRGWLPRLDDRTWGYADEAVYGAVPSGAAARSGILVGLENRAAAQAEDEVLKAWRSWTLSLASSPLPALPNLARATITPDSTWTVERGARLLEAIASKLSTARSLDATVGPGRTGYTARLVGYHPRSDGSSTILSATIELTPRHSSQAPHSVLHHSAGDAFHSSRITTDSWVVRIEISPAAAAGNAADWIETLLALDR